MAILLSHLLNAGIIGKCYHHQLGETFNVVPLVVPEHFFSIQLLSTIDFSIMLYGYLICFSSVNDLWALVSGEIGEKDPHEFCFLVEAVTYQGEYLKESFLSILCIIFVTIWQGL